MSGIIRGAAKEKKLTVFSARRKAPEKVEPFVHAGIRYETTVNGREFGFAQDGGVLLAFDDQSGAQLWAMQVYTININQKFERDAQICYIISITLNEDGKSLVIRNERRQQFLVNLADRAITERAITECAITERAITRNVRLRYANRTYDPTFLYGSTVLWASFYSSNRGDLQRAQCQNWTFLPQMLLC